MKKNPFRDNGGKPTFKLAIVMYADILGWGQSVLDAFHAGTEKEFLLKRRHILGEAYRTVRRHARALDKSRPPSFGVKVFTDNIVIAIPAQYAGGELEPELGQVFRVCSGLQIRLAMQGLFMRGAISLGHHYMDDDMAVGDALLEAVQFDKSGQPPRIILADSIKPLVRLHASFYKDGIQRAPHRSHLLLDEDSQVFIDYLSEAFALGDGMIFLDALEKHREAIQQALVSFPSGAIHQKYLWAAKYHNFACLEHRSFSVDYEEQVPGVLQQFEELRRLAIDVGGQRAKLRRLSVGDVETFSDHFVKQRRAALRRSQSR